VSRGAPVELVLLWHFHQPDYRSPRDLHSELPWVRLHASKDYLAMARHLERHPGVRAVCNFTPILVDQLEESIAGAPDRLFGLMAQPLAALSAGQRAEVAARASLAPPWAWERWPAYASLARRARASRDGGAPVSEAELIGLECHFLLGWTNPMFHGEPEAAEALASRSSLTEAHRDALLALHARLAGQILPAYRALAARGQIELTASPYTHPILPLLVDVRSALRSRPNAPLPAEPFAAPEDAGTQVRRAIERHARAFGARPAGLWPSEGSVSPEAAEIVARAGVRWMASDEGVLWRSLPPGERSRGQLHRPWRFATPTGDITLLFRDHELSDRIGFVYQRWDPAQAAQDFVERLRRIGEEHEGAEPPLVSVILDGENCWEHYADDGGPFLEALYGALESDPTLRTLTPAQGLAGREPARLENLHSGSWIDADFRIWIGHPEKNRAWDLIARTRRALVQAGSSPESHPEAWRALYSGEGSDWFWWFGDDHETSDRDVFDRLFREHLQAACERAGLVAPGELRVPITRAGRGVRSSEPLGYLEPEIDGRETSFYEWHEAGRFEAGAGGSMHRGPGRARRLYFGFDARLFYLRLDVEGEMPGVIEIEFLAPLPGRVRIPLGDGAGAIEWRDARGSGPLEGARAAASEIVEVALPRTALELGSGAEFGLIVHLLESGNTVESIPADDALRSKLPGPEFPGEHWSV
jgi:alpha-amylase/alpha-mannosidase (GH57 family)